ncbi:STAS domain-containing protein [Streptomyces subrutilus]|uniref:STAS domain-containing protein n=1 Tax=Streptomyces subrutilus TaxID=36818 RepID=UPI0033D440A8
MTNLPSGPLHLTRLDTPDTTRLELRGELDHYCADLLLAAVDRVLADRVDLRDLHLHCAGLTAVDSVGLSALLMARRRTGAAAVRLHIEKRPLRLDRLLELTGTLGYLTTPEAGAQHTSSTPKQRSAASEEAIPARPGTTDSV